MSYDPNMRQRGGAAASSAGYGQGGGGYGGASSGYGGGYSAPAPGNNGGYGGGGGQGSGYGGYSSSQGENFGAAASLDQVGLFVKKMMINILFAFSKIIVYVVVLPSSLPFIFHVIYFVFLSIKQKHKRVIQVKETRVAKKVWPSKH